MKKEYKKPFASFEEFEKREILTASSTGGSGVDEGEWDIHG